MELGRGIGLHTTSSSTKGLFQIPSTQCYFKKKREKAAACKESMLKVNNALTVNDAA